MPYSYPKNLPTWAKNLPKGAQKIAVNVFNAVLKDTKDENQARQAAWAQIKNKYKKVGDKWVKKTLSIHLDESISSWDELTDDVKELPGQLSIAWMKIFNSLVAFNDSLPIAREKAWKAIKRYVYNSNGAWKFKTILPIEMILKREIRKAKDMNMTVNTIRFFKSTEKNDGMFKLFIPFEKTIDFDSGDKKGKFLKGVASASWLDKTDELVMPQFIEKMKKTALNLPVFLDHIHDTEHLLGKVVEVANDEKSFVPITKLEDEYSEQNQNGSKMVSRLIERINNGITFGYSIGGRVTKAVKVYREDIGRSVKKLLDGDIYEISVTPIAALPGSDVKLFFKNFDDSKFIVLDEFKDDEKSFYKNAAEELEMDVTETKTAPEYKIKGYGDSGDDSDKEYFWIDFQQAVDKYKKLSVKQPSLEEINVDDLPKQCFLFSTGLKKDWRYPYKYVVSQHNGDLRLQIHMELLDKSFYQAMKDDNKNAVLLLKSVRDKLGLYDKEYKFINFRKLLIGTLLDAVRAKEARQELWSLVDEFHMLINDIIYHPDLTVDEKIADIRSLTGQLVDEVTSLSAIIAKEVVLVVKNLSLED